jgi:TolA-binding protein
MLRRVLAFALIAPAALFAADKPNPQLQELQRDVAQLQDEVRQLKQALEQKIAASTSQLETMTKSFSELHSTVAAVQKTVEDRTRELSPMLAAQGSKVDAVNSALATMQQAFSDLTASVNRMQTQMTDLSNSVKVIATPAPKPPSAEELLKSAEADRLGAKYDLAAQEYGDFLKSFADSPMADVAQFQLGMVHYQVKDMESAVKDFDAVVKNYPKSQKLPESLFYKAKALQAMERAPDATAACAELKRRFPRNEFASQCAAPRR